MDEQRGFTRFSFNKQIVLETDAGERYTVAIDNLSLKGGAFTVQEDSSFDLGTHLAFTLVFHEDEDITVKGDATIVWKKDAMYGLQFDNMGSDYFSHLKRLLELNYTDE